MVFGALTNNPCDKPAELPSISTVGGAPVHAPPAVASMIAVSLIPGSGESGAILWGPAPGMANEIVSVKPACALAVLSAWRSEPGPLSFVLVTMSVNGTGVGVDGNVVTGGVLLPVFEETDATVIVT
jgi:hypothetical protein